MVKQVFGGRYIIKRVTHIKEIISRVRSFGIGSRAVDLYVLDHLPLLLIRLLLVYVFLLQAFGGHRLFLSVSRRPFFRLFVLLVLLFSLFPMSSFSDKEKQNHQKKCAKIKLAWAFLHTCLLREMCMHALM
jgi:hypothetical protein